MVTGKLISEYQMKILSLFRDSPVKLIVVYFYKVDYKAEDR